MITRAYNFDFWQAWLHLGLGEEIDSVPAPVRAAGAWLLHPGPGTLFEIAGVEEARAMAGVEKVIMRQQPGKVCGERLGSGQEAGHILVSGRDREQVARRLVDTHAKIRFVMGP